MAKAATAEWERRGWIPTEEQMGKGADDRNAWTREGDEIVLRLSVNDYETLLLMLGFAAGAVSRESHQNIFWRWVALVNRINEGNPQFTPYEIPLAFTTK